MADNKQYPDSPESLVKNVEQLVSLPEVCFLVNDLVNDPLSELEDIGQVIAQDPDLTARLLKLVNSSYYGFSKKIETVSRAILMVGLKDLQHMVWASTAVETFANLSPDEANMAVYWRHSIFTAVVARLLARQANILHPERLFVAGLLHDVGHLLIYTRLPKQAAKILAERNKREGIHSVCDIERQILGFDHAEVAQALFKEWQLSDHLGYAVRFHHQPSAAPDEYILDASILHMADIMAHALELGEEDSMKQVCDPVAWELLKLDEKRVKPVLHEAVMQFLEALELLLPGASQRI